MPTNTDPELIQSLTAIVGRSGIETDPDRLLPSLTEWRGLYRGHAEALVAPDSAGQAAEVLQLCQARGVGVVPQGGNTGLVGGAIPDSTPERPQIILSARRLNQIREVDADNYTITVEAGCLLADVQAAAESADRLFPLSLAAEGSCQIGGNIATNAGGTNVLRYGNTRDLVLGLEVVLPDGRLYSELKGLRKDNTGYDLKHLFIGSEGTLGLITAATLKLFPRPASVATAWVAVTDPAAAIRLNSEARRLLGDQLMALELINRQAVELVLAHIDGTRNPLDEVHDWVVLLELGSARPGVAADETLGEFLATALDAGLVTDAALAQNDTQRSEFWRLRHSISEAQKLAGAGIKHDISVPVSRIGAFLEQAEQWVRRELPGARIVAFGHMGDGNLHYNLNQPDELDRDAFIDQWEAISAGVHSIAVDLGGSFSAEHGIGALKVGELQRLGDAVELALMRQVKQAIDPGGIMNPGKVLIE